ncbi:hypothetical protein DFH07DRAFT_967851 [Mycena maculata]|uniref:Uncharacterized protein n=1 Tax=Mycena maculata TaxID=230809 RepID=A0AAD7I3S1_9AGAR|nr:hypothetical protein DFH07DRAFT_967851 [Mycena maculata]
MPPKPKPTAVSPKAKSASVTAHLFDVFNHSSAYALSQHLLDPSSIHDASRPELKTCVVEALPALRYIRRNIDYKQLDDRGRIFYSGINIVMDRLGTIPAEWLGFCLKEVEHDYDLALLVKEVPPARAEIPLGPGDYAPMANAFANYNGGTVSQAQIQSFLKGLPALPTMPISPEPASRSSTPVEPVKLSAKSTAPTASSSKPAVPAAAQPSKPRQVHVAVPDPYVSYSCPSQTIDFFLSPSKKRTRDSAGLDSEASEADEHSEAEAPPDPKPKRSDTLRKKKTKTESPGPAPTKPTKSRKKAKGKAKEDVDSGKIPDAPHRRHRSPGSGTISRTNQDPDSSKIAKFIAARVQQAKGAKAGTPVQLNVDADGNSDNFGDPNDVFLYLIRKKAASPPDHFTTGHPTTTSHRRLDSDTYVERFESLELIDAQKNLEVNIDKALTPVEPCVFCILQRVECIPITFGHGCLNCFLKNLRHCCHTATMTELIKFHVEFADRYAAASHTTEIIVDQFQRTATRLSSITALYNDASTDFAEAFDHLVRHFNSCVKRFGDETFATRFSDSSSAVRDHLADLVAQFRGTFKSFKNIDLSDVDFGMVPRPIGTGRALIDIAEDSSEAGDVAGSDEEGEDEADEEVVEVEAPRKTSKSPSKASSKPYPRRPPSTRNRAAPVARE